MNNQAQQEQQFVKTRMNNQDQQEDMQPHERLAKFNRFYSIVRKSFQNLYSKKILPNFIYHGIR